MWRTRTNPKPSDPGSGWVRQICRLAGRPTLVVAYRLLMEDVNIWVLMSGWGRPIQLNLKPWNSRTHRTEQYRAQNWEHKNQTRTEPKFSAQVCEELKPNRTLTFVRTWIEPNPSSEGSFPSLEYTMGGGSATPLKAWTALSSPASPTGAYSLGLQQVAIPVQVYV